MKFGVHIYNGQSPNTLANWKGNLKKKQLRLVNYPESQEENCESVVKDILINKMNLDIDIESAFRIGKFGYKGKPRHIVFKVLKVADKHKIFQKKHKALKDEEFYIIDDLTKADLQVKKEAQPEIEQLKKEGKH